MKIYEIEGYIKGKYQYVKDDLKVRDQKQKVSMLSPNVSYPQEFIKEFLGIDVGERLIEGTAYDLIKTGIDYGVISKEAITIKEFDYFKKGDTVHFKYIPVCYSDDELYIFTSEDLPNASVDNGCDYLYWEDFVDNFLMKPVFSSLEERIDSILKESIEKFPNTRDEEQLRAHYFHGCEYIIRALKLANVNNIFLDLRWFERELEEVRSLIDFTRDWLTVSLFPNSILTPVEAFKTVVKGGKVKDEEGRIYTEKDDINWRGKLYEEVC